jgi:hypothetical protein
MFLHATRLAGLVIAAISLPSLSAFPVELDEANISAIEFDDAEWYLDVGIYGTSDITAATVIVPDTGSTVLTLECDPVPAGAECLISDIESGPFSSLATLLQTYPAGDYRLSINGGTRTASLSFSATAPDGSVEIMSPLNGATGVSPTPRVDYLNSCLNCSVLGFLLDGIFDELDDPLEYETHAQFSIGSILYSDWTSPTKPTQLPQGDYLVGGVAGIVSFSTESFDQGIGPAFEFDYSNGTGKFAASIFSVPEPSSAAMAFAALGTVGALVAIKRTNRTGLRDTPRRRLGSCQKYYAG